MSINDKGCVSTSLGTEIYDEYYHPPTGKKNISYQFIAPSGKEFVATHESLHVCRQRCVAWCIDNHIKELPFQLSSACPAHLRERVIFY